MLPSTKSGETYLVAPEGCLAGIDPANCQNSRGADIFQSSQNIGFQTNASSSWSAIGQYDVDLEQALNDTAVGLFGFDSVSLGAAADSTSLSLSRQVVASVGDLSYYLGLLPLGQAASSFSSQAINSFLFQLRGASKIPSLSYAYTAGAKYRLKSVFGSLILGGYDATRFKANINGFSFTFSTDPSRLLTVSVASIMGTNTLEGTISMTSGAHFSVIDSTVPHLWLPRDVCTQFEKAFGLTYDARTDLYLVNDTIHKQLQSKNPTVTIKLANSLDTSTNYTNIQLPYAAFDLQASYPFYKNATNYFPIRRAANDSQYVLGRTLLQEAYLIVDYERANFTVAPAVFPDPLPAANVITITSPNSKTASNTSSGLGAGAIAGIIIGVLLLLSLGAAGIFIFLRKRHAQTKASSHELESKSISASSQDIIVAPQKSPGLHEACGNPLTELAVSGHGYYSRQVQDQKTVISVSETPQELHAESRTPVTPRWQEVVPPQGHDPYAESDEDMLSPGVSSVRTDDRMPPGFSAHQSVVSPMAMHFQKRRDDLAHPFAAHDGDQGRSFGR